MSASHILHKLKIHARVPWVVTAAIIAIYTVVIASILAVFEHGLAGRVAEYQASVSVTVVSLCSLIVSVLVYSLFQRVEDLNVRNRLRVEYFPAGSKDEPDMSATMYNEATRIITKARPEQTAKILAVNSFHEIFAAPDAEKAHSSYFDALERRLGTIPYHRIVQCNDPTNLWKRLSPPFQHHFETIVAKRDSGKCENEVILNFAPAIFPTAYVMVHYKDGTSDLIWQLNEYIDPASADGAVFRPRGLLIIHDPDRQLTRYFDDWFTRLVNKSLGPVNKNHLSSPAH